SEGPADPGPDVGLPDRRWIRGARRRSGPEGGQRLNDCRWKAPRRIQGTEGRRFYGVWLMDLLRVLLGCSLPNGEPEAARHAVMGGTGVGMGVAGQPSHPVQPGVGRS